MHYMELGGAESALLGLLQSIDTGMVDVDLFVYDHRGDFFPLIPTDKINLLPQVGVYSMLERPLAEVIRKGYYRLALMRLIGNWDAKVTGGSAIVTQPKWASKVLPDIANDNDNSDYSSIVHRPSSSSIYDLAISFVTPHYFVLDHVNAKKKVGWIHTDYTKIPVDAKREVKMWERLDNIVSISPDVTKTFLQVFPSLKEKIVEIENILSPTFVKQRAETPTDLSDFNRYNNDFIDIEDHDEAGNKNLSKSVKSVGKEYVLLSIGRICHQKNFDNVPFIAKIMKENGSKFHWFIMGPGNHDAIDKTIEETGTDDVITFLGPKSNPYPYIKACDIYLQPSRYEGKSVTVREAQMLCKPVVVTNYATAPSQIKDGKDGVIVPMDNEGCARGIVDFLKDLDKQQRIKDYLKDHDYGNVSEVEKVYDLLKG